MGSIFFVQRGASSPNQSQNGAPEIGSASQPNMNPTIRWQCAVKQAFSTERQLTALTERSLRVAASMAIDIRD